MIIVVLHGRVLGSLLPIDGGGMGPRFAPIQGAEDFQVLARIIFAAGWL